MRICSVCNQTYPNPTQRFCLNDGSPLAEAPSPQSAATGLQSPMNATPRSSPNAAQQIILPPGKKRGWLGNLVGGLTGAPPQVEIQIDRPAGAYRAGDAVRARIKIHAPEAIAVNQIYAGLLFEENCKEAHEHTDSDGDRSTSYRWRAYPKWIEQHRLAGEVELPAGFEQTFEFAYRIPNGIIPTYAGKIAQLNTKVRVYIDRPAATDFTQDAYVPVIVPFTGGETPIRKIMRATAPGCAVQIGFWLPRLNYRHGETVAGRVYIEPQSEVKVRSIKLALNRQETTTGGDKNNGEKWSEHTINFAGETRLQPGALRAFDFQIELPRGWQPTYRTHLSRSEAKLELKLDVPWGSDFNGAQQIFIHGDL